ncbi:MAG: class II aldolase/adducin family protein [Phormidesmis sp.]
MIDEGVTKYQCDWLKADAVAPSSTVDLNGYRNALRQLNLIGEYPNGIGFGNISQRLPNTEQFVISGTQTGHLLALSAADYALVTDFDPVRNHLTCQGLRQASSESLTHGVIYASNPAIGAIIHVHHPILWQQLLNQVPTTRADVPYGTPEMAAETQRLFDESSLRQVKIFAMAGHEDGVVAFGETLQTAYRVLVNWGVMTGTVPASALQLPYQLASPIADFPA